MYAEKLHILYNNKVVGQNCLNVVVFQDYALGVPKHLKIFTTPEH